MKNNNYNDFNGYINVNEIKTVFNNHFNDLLAIINDDKRVPTFMMNNIKLFVGIREKMILNKFRISKVDIVTCLGNDYFVIKLSAKNKDKDIGFANISLTLSPDKTSLIIADIASSNSYIQHTLYLIAIYNDDYIRNVLLQASAYKEIFSKENNNEHISCIKNLHNQKISSGILEKLLLDKNSTSTNLFVKFDDLPKQLQQFFDPYLQLPLEDEYKRTK